MQDNSLELYNTWNPLLTPHTTRCNNTNYAFCPHRIICVSSVTINSDYIFLQTKLQGFYSGHELCSLRGKYYNFICVAGIPAEANIFIQTEISSVRTTCIYQSVNIKLHSVQNNSDNNMRTDYDELRNTLIPDICALTCSISAGRLPRIPQCSHLDTCQSLR